MKPLKRYSTLNYQVAAKARPIPTKQQVSDWVECVLAALREKGGLSVRLVDEEEGKTLNAQFRQKSYATNVLSFPMEKPYFGDIVICVPVVLQEAVTQHKSWQSHFAHMVMHGVLHLLGYDHQTAQQAVRMESLEKQLLQRFGFDNE